MINHSDVESLVTESQRLRTELLKTAAKLEAFSEQLLLEAASLREENSDADGRPDPGADPPSG